MSSRAGTPGAIAIVLAWPGVWPAIRVGLVSAFVIGGFTKLFDFAGAITEQEHFGLRPGWLWAALAITVEIGGSALVVAGRWGWVGGGGPGGAARVGGRAAREF